MTSQYDDEEEGQEIAGEGEDLGEVSLDELEELEEDDVTGHRVVTMNEDDEDPYSSGAYFDE